MYYLWVHCLSKFWLNLTETSSLNQSLVCQAKCVCDSQIGVLSATKQDSWCWRQGPCLLVWKASSGITSLLHTLQVFFRHRKNKTASGDRKSRQGRNKKMTSKKSRGRGKVEWYVQDELYEVFGRGKKSPKKESNKSQHQKKKLLQKKPNDFQSTDADRITCKGTHYSMGA